MGTQKQPAAPSLDELWNRSHFVELAASQRVRGQRRALTEPMTSPSHAAAPSVVVLGTVRRLNRRDAKDQSLW